MSDLSDQIDRALEELVSVGDINELFRKLSSSKEPPDGFSGSCLYYYKEVIKALRIAFREMSGRERFSNNQEALDETETKILPTLYVIAVRAFCDGVQIGQKQISIVKKYKFFRRMDEIFEQPGFRSESELYQMSIETDTEAVQRLRRFVYNRATTFAGMTNFADADVDSTHVWDLWMMSGQSSAITCYLAGLRLGQRWTEDDQLMGILTATEKESTDG